MTLSRAWRGSQETRPPQHRGPAGPGRGARDAQRPPAPCAPCPGRPTKRRLPQNQPPAPASLQGARVRWRGMGLGKAGGEGPLAPSCAYPRVRRDIPPARAAPRSPSRRLSPERQPGRGQGASARAAPGPGAAPGGAGASQRPPPPVKSSAAAGARRGTFLSPAKRVGAARAWRAGSRAGPAGGWGRGRGRGGPAGGDRPRACSRSAGSAGDGGVSRETRLGTGHR